MAAATTPRERIAAVIRGNFAACQFRPAVISAWLAFYVQAQNDPEARRLLRIYRRRLESNLLHPLRELTTREQCARDRRDRRRADRRAVDPPLARRRQARIPDGAARLVEDAVSEALRRAHA